MLALLDAQPARMLRNLSRPHDWRPHGVHEHLVQLEHVYPMSGVLASWPLDHVGKLEELRLEWGALQAAYARRGLGRLQDYAQLNLSVGGHTSSRDPYGTRAALHALLRRRPTLRHAVCTLLLPDYKCFAYSFAECTNQSVPRRV